MINAVSMKNKNISFFLLTGYVKENLTIPNTLYATLNLNTTSINMTNSKYLLKDSWVPGTTINTLHVQTHLLLTTVQCDR